MPHPVRIEGRIMLSDGTITGFALTQEYGWQQWGNTTENLAETGELLDDILEVAVIEHGLAEPHEED